MKGLDGFLDRDRAQFDLPPRPQKAASGGS